MHGLCEAPYHFGRIALRVQRDESRSGRIPALLKNLEQGVLLVTGPFKINGVPLRRINSRYVIATSYKVDISGLDEKKVNEVSQPKYFTAEKAKEKAGADAFFKQGEKPQVRFFKVLAAV